MARAKRHGDHPMEEQDGKRNRLKQNNDNDDADFTDIVGGCGKWQWQIFLIYFLTCLPTAWHNLVMTFFAPNYDHWCARTDEAIKANVSAETWKETMIPKMVSEEGQVHYSHCDRYATDFNITDFLPSLLQETEGNFLSIRNISNASISCQKWEYDDTFYSSTVVSQWDLVCDREWLVSVTKSVFMAGYFVAVLVLGQVSDKKGRRPVLLMCAVVLLLSGFVCAFSVSFVMFAVTRLFVALGASGLLTTGFVTFMEIVGVEHRSMFGVGIGLGWATGYVLLPAIAYLIPDWFWLQIALTLPCILLLLLWWLVPESPRWLLTQGQREKAKEIMCTIAERNNKDASSLKDSIGNFCNQYEKDGDGKIETGNILDLFRTRGMCQKTFILYLNWSVNSFVYYGISYNTNDLGGSPSLNFLISGAVEFPAVVVTILIMKKLGRRIPLTGFMVASGIFCILTLPVPEEMTWLRVTLAMIGKFCITSSFDIVYVYSAEIYPTVLRNIGIGTSSMCGRLGSILAPFVRELGSATHLSVPYLCFGGLSIVSGFLVLLLPETNSCKIPDTIQEAARLGRKGKDRRTVEKGEELIKDKVALHFVESNIEENDPESLPLKETQT